MRVDLFSPCRMLRPTTTGLFDGRLCDGLAANGCEVEVAYPYEYIPQNIRRQDFVEHYGIKSALKFFQLATPLHWRMSERLQGVLAAPF